MNDEERMPAGREPNFLLIGAQKAGTTFVGNLLRGHPGIFLLDGEPHYFDRGDDTPAGYRMRFAAAGDRGIAGEKTPSYLFLEQVPKRIRDELGPDVKLLAILRDPVDRAYSQYWMSFRRGYETLSFEDAVAAEEERIARGEFELMNFSYVKRGMYAEQLGRYLVLFPPENIKVMVFEELMQDVHAHYKELLGFLGCGSHSLPPGQQRKVHEGRVGLSRYLKGAWTNRRLSPKNIARNMVDVLRGGDLQYPSLRTSTRRKLLAAFDADITALERMLNRDLTAWRGAGRTGGR